jgi:hypothetical protein
LAEPSDQVRHVTYQRAVHPRRGNWRKIIVLVAIIFAAWLSLKVYRATIREPVIRFYGRLVDETGQPVSGAELTVGISRRHGGPWRVPALFGPPDGTTIALHVTTNSQGEFTIRDKGTGLSVQKAEKAGYRPLAWTHGYDFDDERLNGHPFDSRIESRETFVLEHPPIALFYGRVVDDQGRPVAGAMVTPIFRDTYSPEVRGPSVQTAGDGTFTVSGRGTTVFIDGIYKDGFSSFSPRATYELVGPKANDRPYGATKEHPAILVLHP